MASKILAIILFTTMVVSVAGTCSLLTIDGGLASLGCIVARLCQNPSKAAAFFACYDQAPGKAQFSQCQAQAFGGRVLNTPQNVLYACFHLPRLALYGQCLPGAMAAAGVDQKAAVLAVNKCQGAVLGLRT